METLEMMPVRIRIAAIVRKAIYSGEYKSGDELSLTDIAAQLGVSRTPVREAFQELEGEGLITLRMNKGAVVNTVDRKFITETLKVPEDQIIEDCSVEDAKGETFAQFKDELIGKGFLNPTDEDVLSYALFPQVAEEFFKKHYQQVTAYKR